jgi:cell wall-associated NlpC family hydrolase
LIVALRRARLTALAVLCTSATALAAAMPAQADRIGDTRAQADRAWARIQSEGVRLEQVVERANGAHLRLVRTESRIRNNQAVLSATRVNLAHSERALSASLISAYKSPLPDPLQAALSARNFGQVLEQFALLDRTNSYNADMLRAIRIYKGEILRRRRVLARQRAQRLATVAELDSLRARIRSSVTAEKRRYAGLRAEVRRLLEDRRRAEIAASRRAAARAQAGPATAATVAVNDIGGVSAAGAAAGDALPVAAVPAPSSVGAGAVGSALSQLGTPYVAGGAAPGGFDCSGLVSWAYAQAGRPGLPHFTGALWTSGTHIASQGDLAPGDLVFFDGLGHVGMYIGGGQFVESPHTGDVVKVSQLASRSDYLGAVRISG